MLDRKQVVAAFVALMLGWSMLGAAAQTGKETSKLPGEAESSSMGPASGNKDGANNGVGTAGSLDHDAGTASSTVAGVNGGKTGFGGNTIKPDKGNEVETDPTQGGGKPH